MSNASGRRYCLRLRPGLSLVALAMFLILIGLSVWQIQRLAWKEALLAQVTASEKLPPLDQAALPGCDFLFRSVRLVNFAPNLAELIKWQGRIEDGKAGTRLLYPMKIGDTLMLADLGFLESEQTLQTYPPQNVTAIIRPWPQANRFTPADNPAQNRWYRLNRQTLKTELQHTLAPCMLAVMENPAANPVPVWRQPASSLRNEHRQYAIFWAVMAVCVVVISLLMQIQRDEMKAAA